MSDVKPQFPIGKTQWREWNDEQREAFNAAREAGVPHLEAIAAVNEDRDRPKKSIIDVLGDVVETAVAVSSVVGVVDGTAKVVKRAVRKKKAK